MISMLSSSGGALPASATSVPHYLQYYPRTYVAPRIHSPLTIDGNLTKPAWEEVPWSDLFDDIRGTDDAPPEDRPPLSCATRIKMLHDDEYLYIGALLHADADHPVVTSFTDRNDPIFQRDSDFEVFIDPTMTTHNYKEFEVNAYNTVWNLLLDKSYIDGGKEHSGRIAQPGQDLYYDVRRQQSAVQILEGSVNDPSSTTTVWSVEIAMAYTDLMVTKPMTSAVETLNYAPHPNKLYPHFWRINFSRVERQGDLNWTWQPQVEWNPIERRYQGNVNMHLPNAWGYLVLGDNVVSSQGENSEDSITTTTTPQDPTWPIRMAAMNVYAAQHAYFQETIRTMTATTTMIQDDHGGQFASHVSDLEAWLDLELMDHVVALVDIELSAAKDAFLAILHSRDGAHEATIRQDRFLLVNAPSQLQDVGMTRSS